VPLDRRLAKASALFRNVNVTVASDPSLQPINAAGGARKTRYAINFT
jgi:hypothetical protein